MGLLGYNDLKQFAVPTGWDAGELSKYALVDGTTAEEFYNDLTAALQGEAEAMMNDPFYGLLFTTTEELGLEYAQGNTTVGMEERTEYARSDARRDTTIGHMLPLNSYGKGLGFTYDFLRKARRRQLEVNISGRVYDVRQTFQKNLLTRFFSSTDNQLGSSGYDVAFVKGGGSVSYIPPAYGGQTFAATHNHFDRKAATGEFDDALDAGVGHLWEHGIFGPYIGIVPLGQISTYTALTGFYKPQRQELVYPNTAALAQIQDETFFGIYETAHGLVYLHATPRLPSNYLGVTKSYGFNNDMNPLAVRISPDLQFNIVAMRGEGFRQFPMENMEIIHEHGVGVNDRLNGYACYFNASGNYSNPTIS